MLNLDHLITEALKEDLGNGDHSALSCIPAEEKGKALLKIKQDGILAGMEVAQQIFNFVEKESVFRGFKADGEAMVNGEIGFEVEAHVRTILSCERLVLNCMQRMSGIATLTRQYVDKLKGYSTKILDTRKTTPNFRILEKEAVRIGGGENHRFGLFDMIMLKDNHIDYAGGIAAAIDKAHQYTVSRQLPLKIEVETRNLDDVKTVCEVGVGKVFRIMLDNFTPGQIKKALQLIDHRFETEASGGINLDTVEKYAATGIDYVSVGGLIHQAKSLDLSLKAEIG
ncbi:MAG TPA: carboxylating nicotinate-nucleotide diphosphorylase [Arachidicoccus sp.]|nr:carboxylating nicotinate-nucleotide diphosphorylase [Arachidicoccus sp.]